MNWDAIAATGEIVGAVAVVLSLIYLASQIRANNQYLKFEANRYIFDSIVPVIDNILSDDALVVLLLKDEDALSEVEKAKLLLIGRRIIQAIRQVWNNLELLDPRTAEGARKIYSAMYHRPKFNYGMRLVWPDFKNALEPDFVDWFEMNIIDQNANET